MARSKSKQNRTRMLRRIRLGKAKKAEKKRIKVLKEARQAERKAKQNKGTETVPPLVPATSSPANPKTAGPDSVTPKPTLTQQGIPRASFIGRDELDRFCASRIGYGNLKAGYWFLGAEEGFSNSGQNVLSLWLREAAVEDLYEAHQRRGQMDHLDSVDGQRQSTWAFCIRLLLALQGKEHGDGPVLDYQRRRWGRRDGETLLAELLPLPNPNRQAWMYSAHSGIAGYLANRALFEAQWLGPRTDLLRSMILVHRPAVFVAYTKGCWKSYEGIFDGARWQTIDAGAGEAQVAVWNGIRLAMIQSYARELDKPEYQEFPSKDLVAHLTGGAPANASRTLPDDGCEIDPTEPVAALEADTIDPVATPVADTINPTDPMSALEGLGFRRGAMGLEGDRRYDHPDISGPGSVYAMPNRLTATGVYRTWLPQLVQPNGRDNADRYDAWSGAQLTSLLKRLRDHFEH